MEMWLFISMIDHIELEIEHFNVDEHEGESVLVLSAEED